MIQSLEMYKPTILEFAVERAYRRAGISCPRDIQLDVFISDMEVWVHELPRPSTNYQFHSRYTIVIDNRLPEQQQRVELAHELAHVLMHAGRQETLPVDIRRKQEWQADQFAMYALVPTYMIADCIEEIRARSRGELVEQLADRFTVPTPFMDARLELLEERLKSLRYEEDLKRRIESASAGIDYTYRHPLNKRIEYLVREGKVIGRRMRSDT